MKLCCKYRGLSRSRLKFWTDDFVYYRNGRHSRHVSGKVTREKHLEQRLGTHGLGDQARI